MGCDPWCRSYGCDGSCALDDAPDPQRERLQLTGCLIRLAVAAVIVWLLAGCAEWERAEVPPGATFIVPASPKIAQRMRDDMHVWRCAACGEWSPDEFSDCPSCGARKP